MQHITLKSIANNPDIKEGMSREEIDAAIRRHAEYEQLYDKPYVDNRKVRVTGPFTVESLSPHRSLAGLRADEPVSVVQAAADPDGATFEQTILDNLKAAGIQNGKRAERLTFDVVEPYAANHIQAVGVREDAPSGAPRRVGISIGPQYGTVAPAFVKAAAREGVKATDLDLLCVLGFAFDPQVLNVAEEFTATDESFDVAAERALGRIPVLLVRMNSDLLMGEELKKTGAGNLFTVFGEPDIAVKVEGGEVTVELLGVDVYDPTTGEVRSDGTDRVALWMIDTEYDGESFFVRHCYFTGGQDPYARLKKALKADIDEEAWASLYRTDSRPFPIPSSGQHRGQGDQRLRRRGAQGLRSGLRIAGRRPALLSGSTSRATMAYRHMFLLGAWAHCSGGASIRQEVSSARVDPSPHGGSLGPPAWGALCVGVRAPSRAMGNRAERSPPALRRRVRRLPLVVRPGDPLVDG